MDNLSRRIVLTTLFPQYHQMLSRKGIPFTLPSCFFRSLNSSRYFSFTFFVCLPKGSRHHPASRPIHCISAFIPVMNPLDGYILVDAGTNAKAAEKAIRKLHINPDDVEYILLTHSDYDHVASLPEGINRDSITLLKDREILNLLNHQVLCMKAPGHTTGSMMFLLDGMYLFTGDALRVSWKKLGVHPFSMDEDTAFKTILIMEEIITGSNLVLTAHYGYYPGEDLTLSLKE